MARPNLLRVHRGGERSGAIERGGLENERAEIRVPKLRGIAQFHVAQILSRAFQQPRRIGQRSAAGKNQRDVIFADHHQADGTLQFERGNAPRIDRLAGCGKRFSYDAPQLFRERLELRVSPDASLENFRDILGR